MQCGPINFIKITWHIPIPFYFSVKRESWGKKIMNGKHILDGVCAFFVSFAENKILLSLKAVTKSSLFMYLTTMAVVLNFT